MRRLSLVCGSLAVIALSGLVATCGDPESKLPTSPSSPSASSVEISGPASVAPGQSAQFGLLVRRSDGSTKLASSVVWRSSSSNLRVDASGLAAAQQVGEAELSAQATIDGSTRGSIRQIVMLPDGTYRVVGMVTENEFQTAVAGASVEVTGTPLVATTGLDGRYRLYGVPPEATVRVTAAGYQPYEQSLRLTAHVTQNFSLTSSGPRLSLTGNYTLAIDVVACSGSRPLSTDLQHRTYDAVLTQTGATVDVTLTEPRFKINSIGRGNQFSGRVGAGGATFTLQSYEGSYYPYYGPVGYPNVAEQLSNGTFLVTQGTAVTLGSAAGLSGQMNGGLSISNWGSGFPTTALFLGNCFGSLRFTLTPR